MARALRFQAAPFKFFFWGEGGGGNVYSLQHFSSIDYPLKSYLGSLFMSCFMGHPATLTNIKVFGCICNATALNNTDKFFQSHIPAIFMGYSNSQKGI